MKANGRVLTDGQAEEAAAAVEAVRRRGYDLADRDRFVAGFRAARYGDDFPTEENRFLNSVP